MTVATVTHRRAFRRVLSPRHALRARVRNSDLVVPPLGSRLQLIRAVLILVSVLSASLLLQLIFVSSLQQEAAQGRLFASIRGQLAGGTAPIGPLDDSGHQIQNGAPIALLEIPAIDVKQVVVQGTAPAVMFNGPGHRRDTPFPGQIGTSVVFGRRAAFGGPFAKIDELKPNDVITVTTGQGTFNFGVLGVRRAGDPAPAAPGPGVARLLLVTASGAAFFPTGVLRVDAQLLGTAVVGQTPVVTGIDLAAQDRAMASDSRTLWALALWLQALILLSFAVVWAWHRWGRSQAWIVFLPPMLLVGLAVCGEAARLLPNLL